MSIKKLFDSTNKSRNYLSDTTQKDAFKDAESGRNVEQLKIKQETFVPQIDYSNPEKFVKYGSAYLYYKSAIERIHDYYPYDGSDAEINEFYNGLLGVEKYIFNNLYPRTNGYAQLSADGWGSNQNQGPEVSGGYGNSDENEYITFYGGPNTSSYSTLASAFDNPHNSKFQSANIYDTNIYQTEGLPDTYGTGSRESNLRTDFDSGITVEFWLQKDAFLAVKTQKEVVFDMWNNEDTSSSDYGRITIELTSSGVGTPFRITAQDGTDGYLTASIGQDIVKGTLTNWGHYAFTFQNSGSALSTKLYVNGLLNEELTGSKGAITGTLGILKSKNMMGRIGALLTAPAGVAGTSSADDYIGAGKLSASIDEFRFWKAARGANNIARHYFTQVRGGVNTDINNATLGVYYKFNEGVTGESSIDSAVLDYAGRVSNGHWIGYDAYSRNTGSAIYESTASATEYKDPIIYSSHGDVVSLKNSLLASGSFHDSNNNSSMLSMLPAWVIEEDEGKTSDLQKMMHIVGTYFDKLSLQIDALPKFKGTNYTSASQKPLPFAQHLPQSLGLYAPELFVDSDVMEKFLSRNQTSLFESDLNDTKNLIYLNLYNNLTNIYKSKGTERSIRNVLRCFNLDDKLLKLRTYSDGRVFPLKNNLEQTIVNETHINFNHSGNLGAVIYQLKDNSNSNSFSFITGNFSSSPVFAYDGASSSFSPGNQQSKYGFTVESDILFPYFNPMEDKIINRPATVSLFGMNEADTQSTASTTWVTASGGADSDDVNFHVYAIRPSVGSKDVYFKLSSSVAPFPFSVLTSSVFSEVYDNRRWNLSLRLKPSIYPYADIVTGSTTYTFDYIFRGANSILGTVQDSFVLTGSVTQAVGQTFLRSPKRLSVGARRTNITGALLQESDVLFSNIKCWTKYLEDDDLNQHLFDTNNKGISGSYRSMSPRASGSAGSLAGTDLHNNRALILDWDFNNVTSSNANGNFYVKDISSGSALVRNNYGWLGKLTGYQYTGYGYNFSPGETGSVDKKLINTYKFVDPESAISSDMISILSDDDKVFGLPVSQTVPSFFYTLEKSMYNAISEEMLTFFAGVVDFNNVIGEPVNRYRGRYKTLEKLRESFFRRVSTVTDVEKFITYYKWFDDAISEIVSQLMPASSDFNADTLNIIESHVLERNKYKSQFPTLEYKPSTEGNVRGINELTYNWRINHHPISDKQNENSEWWRQRANRQDAPVISSGDSAIDEQRNRIRTSAENKNNRSASYFVKTSSAGRTIYQQSTFAIRDLATPYKQKLERSIVYKGGVNFTDNKNIQYTYNALYAGGGLSSSAGGEPIPDNLLLFLADNIEEVKDSVDFTTPPALKKTKREFKVWHGRDYEDGDGYSNVKASYAFPFNIISASVDTVKTGYTELIINNVTGGINVVNIHNDVYGLDMEIPMQGPFTDRVVGGHQSRHIAINTGSSTDSDTCLTRPEAWKILLGTVKGSGGPSTGAFGMVGADYPWFPSSSLYPNPEAPKAVYYRDFVAKRPVNIKNILMTTESAIGNYQKNWQVIHTVGAFSNPKHFIREQPPIPSQISETPSASQGRTFLDIRRTEDGHTELIPSYSVGYLTGTASNSTIIGRFAAPGGIEIMGVGYGDIRSAEYSVYNALNYRNLTVLKPSQGPSGSISEATGSGTPGIRVSDINGKDFGLRAHLARHSAKFGRDPLLVTTPGTSYEESPNMHKVNRNTKTILSITNDGNIFTASSLTLETASQYDNFYVQRPIPRSDRQYAWVTNSIRSEEATDIRFYGMAPTLGPQAGLHSSSADGYVAYFDYVTASQISGASSTQFHQPTTRIGIFVLDPVDDVAGEPNVLGLSLTASNSEYMNSDLLIKQGINTEINDLTSSYFNLLMTRRGNTFGWSWKSARSGDHPILRRHRSVNKLTVLNEGSNAIDIYRLPPVSTRGRPAYVNYIVSASPEEEVTIKTTYNNERIYFNETSLDNLQYPTAQKCTTPFDQLISLGRNNAAYTLNWVQYSENIFPSLRNEYVSRSLERIGYDNRFWREGTTDRVDVGTGSTNSFNLTVSQSCWPLDAQEDFLTRTAPVKIDAPLALFLELISEGKAGELQNNYTMVHTGVGATGLTPVRSIVPGALYSRKHILASPLSVVAPSGVKIAETGSLNRIFLDTVEIYGGEAYWEAGSQAGIVVKSGSTSVFRASASAPWYKDYDNFKNDLKLVAKDYSIIPEFRISEHVADYIKFGLFNKNKFDTFDIPETSINSSTGSFYKDYSNSEFMTNFMQVKSDTNLNAKEIRLVCSAAIRFNPYKGFYPAQRTIDLARQFSSSYASSFVANRAGTIVQNLDGHMRPLVQTLFAPGIVYNSIKSGLAVDYPIVTEPTKIGKEFYGDNRETNNWMVSAANTGSVNVGEGYIGAEFWDLRIPFEAAITPEKYLNNIDFFDLEPHPSASLSVTASWASQTTDDIYSRMANNFFGEVATFFLKDQQFTRLQSDTVTDDLEFPSASIYGARLKIRRSATGPRTYERESGSAGDNTAYSKFGGLVYNGNAYGFGTASFPLPQDPRHKPEFKETFTMYSRPTAFGPPITGRPSGSNAAHAAVKNAQPMDGLAGFNWAYTPPYYHGEAWIDFIFEPQEQKAYDLEKILAETKTVFWRADGGISASVGNAYNTQLIPTYSGSVVFPGLGDQIYDGKNVNFNAMQLSASVNYLGIERVTRQSKDKFGNEISSENETVGKKWIIEPKWETPMLNFNDEGVRPITNANSTLSKPTYGSASVPRGMWHQFGVIPETSDKGIFLEIGDIPTNWLKNHYQVITNNSTYNGYNAAASGSDLYQRMKPLTDVVNFKPEKAKVRLGELSDKKVIKEGVVAIPYIIEGTSEGERISGELSQERKRFLTIPQERIDAAKTTAIGSAAGDSLDASGESIRTLLQKMERYILPPQFDFLSNSDIDPIAMYIFEFSYTLDRDDLSYIWQNLAPRDYKKITLASDSVAHKLGDNEILSEENLMGNENLRWMVFKVKQRSQSNYSKMRTSQVGQSANGGIFDFADEDNGYDICFNWPYDYLSFVELIKVDAEVLYAGTGSRGSRSGGGAMD